MITRKIAAWVMFTLLIATPLSRLYERMYPESMKSYKNFLKTRIAIYGE